MKEGGLTDLVLPFHGEFHQQLLGVGADEDEWRSRFLTGMGELKGCWRGERERDDEKKRFSDILHRTSMPILCTENMLKLMIVSWL